MLFILSCTSRTTTDSVPGKQSEAHGDSSQADVITAQGSATSIFPDTIRPSTLRSFNPVLYYDKKIDTSVFLRKVAFRYSLEGPYQDSLFDRRNDESAILSFLELKVYGTKSRVFRAFLSASRTWYSQSA
jgi:hypothetical protein